MQKFKKNKIENFREIFKNYSVSYSVYSVHSFIPTPDHCPPVISALLCRGRDTLRYGPARSGLLPPAALVTVPRWPTIPPTLVPRSSQHCSAGVISALLCRGRRARRGPPPCRRPGRFGRRCFDGKHSNVSVFD